MLTFHHISIYKCTKYKIQLWRSDLLLLIVGKQKNPSVPYQFVINAYYGAYLQQENQNDCGYTIFFLWIGVFVSSVANKG